MEQPVVRSLLPDCQSEPLYPLFDASFYLEQNPDVAASGIDPFQHYLEHGAAEGRDPNPLFDTSFYLERNPDVAASGMNPLQHYLEHGAAEGRAPHPLFDTSFYLERNPDVAASGINPLQHYLEYGGMEKRSPHLLFDAVFYLEQNPDVASQRMNPLCHYLEYGAAEGRDPHPLFDASFYLERNPEVAATKTDPLCHYLECGAAEGRDPHPLFDASFYLERNPDAAVEKADPLYHYLEYGAAKGCDPHPLFDTSFYLERNPDVAAAGVNPLSHYVRHGAAEGRDPSLLFDTSFYVERYPDAASSGLNPLHHFFEFGQGRCPHPLIEAFADPAPGEPEVSIIVPIYAPTFQHLEMTERCLLSLARHEHRASFEMIAMDDASPVDSGDLYRRCPGIRYFRNSENQGFIGTSNRGATLARGKYVLFLNNNSEVLPGWLDRLVETFETVTDAGLVGSKLLLPDGRLQEASGIVGQDGSAWNYGRGDDPNKPEYNYLRPVDYCSGASIILPRHLWDTLGGFDEHYLPAYGEDSDLAFRVREAGYKVLYQPFSAVIHYEGSSHGGAAEAHKATNSRKLFERWKSVLPSHRRNGDHPEIEHDRGVPARILFLDINTPTPDQDSGSRTAYELLRAFQRLDFKVTFSPAVNFGSQPSYTAALQRIGVECPGLSDVRSLKAHLKEHGHLYDLIFIFRQPVAAMFLHTIREYCPRARILFHTTDLHYLRFEREAVHANNSAIATKAKRVKLSELSIIRTVDCTIVHSSYEKDVLSTECPQSNVYVFPWILDPDPTVTPFEDRDGVLFLANFEHPPNVDAAFYFVEQIFPFIQKKLPGVPLYLMGSHPPDSLRALGSDLIKITGYVPDLKPYFAKCRLSIAPIRYGAGIKGKVAVSLAYGVPSVVSSVAAEGMGLRHRAEVLIADQPAAFAESIVELYTNQHLWEELASHGLDFVANTYSSDAGVQRLQEILEIVHYRSPLTAPAPCLDRA